MTQNKTVVPRISQSSRQALRNPWVLGWFVMLAVVLTANIGMITTAVVTNPGLVNENYYERGRNYERNMRRQQAARAALGWEMLFSPPAQPRAATPEPYRFTARAADGSPLRGAEVRLFAYRPADAGADFQVPLREVEPGRYEADATFPLKGIWDLIVEIRHGDNRNDLAHRLIVQP